MTDRTRGRSPAAGRPPRQPTCGVFGLQALEGRVLLSSTGATLSPLAEAPPAPVMAAAASPGGLTVADRRALIARLTPGDLSASLTKTLRHSGPAAFDASLLKYMDRRDTARYFYRTKDVPGMIDFAGRYGYTKPQLPAKVVRADAVIAHLFPEQPNSADYTVQLPAGTIDWDTTSAPTDNPDFLHTLNRHSFWPELALAYRITGKAAYAKELIAQLQSWSDQTPPLADADAWPDASPHWWLLDVAYRTRNWLQAYYTLLGTPAWTPQANTLFLARIFDHGDFLARVTPGKLAANRTALHAAGLLDLGILFPEFADSATWRDQGASLLFQTLEAQFRPDGGHVEQTPAYQGLAVGTFVETYHLWNLNNLGPWKLANRRRLTNAVESYFQMAGSGLPGLSDTYRASNNPLPFFTRAAAILDDDRYRATPPSFDDLFTIGLDEIPRPDHYINYQMPDRGPAYAMPDSGYYIARGPLSTVYFDAGPKGGAHGHYDLLNFELGGLELPVADPGPFRYDDSPQRRWAISTPAHNTISIDGLNHAAVEQAHSPAIVVDDFTTTADAARITAHHHAYEYLAGRPVVGRTIWVDPRRQPDDTYTRTLALVIDWGQSAAPHTFTSSFTLPGTAITQVAAGVFDNTINRYYKTRVQSLLLPGQTATTQPTVISSSPPPAAPAPATRLTLTQTGQSLRAVTLISQYVYRGENATTPPSITWESAPPAHPGDPVRLRLTRWDGSSEVLEFAPPDLSPLPTPDPEIKPPPDVPPTAPPAAAPGATPFSTAPVRPAPA